MNAMSTLTLGRHDAMQRKPALTEKGAHAGDKENTKRKVVRRDPEKRRQQNLQAQKKYRE